MMYCSIMSNSWNTCRVNQSESTLTFVCVWIIHITLLYFDTDIHFSRSQRSWEQGYVFYTCLWFCSQGEVSVNPPPPADTPPGQSPPPFLGRHPPPLGKHPWADTPLGRHPPRSWADPPPADTGYDQQAGGTHPTGMQSCADEKPMLISL